MERDGQHLVQGASRGDASAVVALLDRHLPDLETYIRIRAGERIRAKESCSDLVQSVCREILENLGEFDYRGEAQFRCWLFKHALHKIADRGRYYDADKRCTAQERPLPTLAVGGAAADLVDAHSPSRVAIGREQLITVERAFDSLPDDYREAVLLHRVVGLSHAEIAAEMGRSEGAVRNLVYRGMARLSLSIEQDEGGSH